MDAFPSEECSSGCESGWTLYLDHPSVSADPSCKQRSGFYPQATTKDEEEEEEEDLSMVSDASSGPPHFSENDGFRYPPSTVAALPNHGGKKRRNDVNENRHRQDQESPISLLDDTASSPLVNFSNNNYVFGNNQASLESGLGYSQGFSATPFQRGSGFIPDHYGFLQSSLSRNQLPNNHWWS